MAGMRRAAALFLLCAFACSAPAPRVPGRVQVGAFLGSEPALLLSAPDAKAAAVVLPSAAGRVVSYALDGENVLYNPSRNGQPQADGG